MGINYKMFSQSFNTIIRNKYERRSQIKILFDKKYKNNGNFDKYKARCVYEFINNLHGTALQFDDLYANSLSDDSIKLIMAIAVANGEDLHSFDVKNAFLQTKIAEGKIY